MASIQKRGPYQFRVQVRVDGHYRSRTFESYADADRWAAILEGRIKGDEYVDRRAAQSTTVKEACEWYLDRIAPLDEKTGRRYPKSNHAKNRMSCLKRWIGSEFADWSLVSVKPWDLIEWRDTLIEEDEYSPQTVTHWLNTLSQVYKEISLFKRLEIENPVIEKVRPAGLRGRDRRLQPGEEEKLFRVLKKSKSSWLYAATVIALETCVRQSELAGLRWSQVRLDADHPHLDLVKTKNDRARRVPLSVRAIETFRGLLPEGVAAIGARKILPIETPRAIGHAWRAVVTDENFPDLRWHDLRHEAISRLFELTDLRDNEIMAISGHLRPEMLTRYTHLRADRLGDRLPGGKLNAGRKL